VWRRVRTPSYEIYRRTEFATLRRIRHAPARSTQCECLYSSWSSSDETRSEFAIRNTMMPMCSRPSANRWKMRRKEFTVLARRSGRELTTNRPHSAERTRFAGEPLVRYARQWQVFSRVSPPLPLPPHRHRRAGL